MHRSQTYGRSSDSMSSVAVVGGGGARDSMERPELERDAEERLELDRAAEDEGS